VDRGRNTRSATADNLVPMTQQVSNVELLDRAKDLFQRVQQLKEHL
jgi:hypothetical protein